MDRSFPANPSSLQETTNNTHAFSFYLEIRKLDGLPAFWANLAESNKPSLFFGALTSIPLFYIDIVILSLFFNFVNLPLFIQNEAPLCPYSIILPYWC